MSRTRIVTLFGSPSVGKSKLTDRLIEKKFDDNYVPTIERRLNVNMLHNNIKYDLTICDTAGLDSYSTIPLQYITNTHGFILVYSINDRQSFECVEDIHRKLVEEKARNNIPLVLVGNKSDLNGERIVSYDEGLRLAQAIGATFVETSAKCGDNIQNVLPLCLTAIDHNNSADTNANKSNNNSTNNKPNSKCTIS